MISLSDRVENMVGKGGNAGFQHFPLFPQCFQREIIITPLFQEINKSIKLEGHDGPVSLHWLLRGISSCQTLQYLGIRLKYKIPNKD